MPMQCARRFVYLILVDRKLCNSSYKCALVRHVRIIWHTFKTSIVVQSHGHVTDDNTCGMQLLVYPYVIYVYIYAKNTVSPTILLAKTFSIKGAYSF